jgi:ankyrin repeat protein
MRCIDLEKSVEMTDENGCTLLHWASASEDSEKLIPDLLRIGVNIRAIDNQGLTALHYLCAKGRAYGVACLLHSGADPNTQANNDHSTPLHYAVRN